MLACAILACSSAIDVPPRWVVDGQRVTWDQGAMDIWGPAEAMPGRHPKIREDAREIERLRRAVVDWLRRHEYCHLDGVRGEVEADACGLAMMQVDRIYLPGDLATICIFLIEEAAESDETHPSGALRCIYLMGE